MSETMTLTANFRHVRLLLAREKAHPEGARDEGDDLLVPLDKEGRLDPREWRMHQASCRVRRFNENGDVNIGRLRRKPGGQWYFDYEEGESDDEIGFHPGDERFLTGEYVSRVHAHLSGGPRRETLTGDGTQPTPRADRHCPGWPRWWFDRLALGHTNPRVSPLGRRHRSGRIRPRHLDRSRPARAGWASMLLPSSP